METVDFELQSGTRPRLGVVDHICFHPLAHTYLDQAAAIAKSLASDLGSNLKVSAFRTKCDVDVSSTSVSLVSGALKNDLAKKLAGLLD